MGDISAWKIYSYAWLSLQVGQNAITHTSKASLSVNAANIGLSKKQFHRHGSVSEAPDISRHTDKVNMSSIELAEFHLDFSPHAIQYFEI